MGLFGSSPASVKALGAYDPNAMSGSDRMMIISAMLSDLGRGDGPQNIMAVRQMMGNQALQRQAQAADQDALGMFGRSAPADPNAPTPMMMPARSIAASPQTGMPALNLPQINAAPAPSGPQMPSIANAADMARLVDAARRGSKVAPMMLDIAKANKAPDPHWAYNTAGDAFNETADQAPAHAANLVSVNNVLTDTHNMKNENKFFPTLDKGQEPVYDGRGNIIGVRTMDGAIKSQAELAQATSTGTEAGKAPFVGMNAEAAAGGTARGQAPFDLIDVPLPDGSTIKMPKSQYLAVQQHAAGLTGAPHAGADAAAPPGLGQTQTPGNKTYAEGQAKAAQEQYQALQTAGSQALGVIPKYQRLGELLDGYNGNKLSPLGTEMAQYMRAIPGLGNFDAKLPNKEAAIALTNQLALQLRDPSQGGGMPGALSNSDRDFLVKSVPNLAQTAQGRKMMVDSAVKLNQRNADVAGMARKWQQRYGRLDAVNPATGKSFQDNLMDWSGRNPLFGASQ
jgi:hypothetical protein